MREEAGTQHRRGGTETGAAWRTGKDCHPRWIVTHKRRTLKELNTPNQGDGLGIFHNGSASFGPISNEVLAAALRNSLFKV